MVDWVVKARHESRCGLQALRWPVHVVKYTHACVRIEVAGRVLVVDPGSWSEPRALVDADAVLITHEHVDHIDVMRLAGVGVPVFAPAEANLGSLDLTRGLDITRVDSGEDFTAAGVPVRAVGARHAAIYDGQPDCANLGYIIDDRLYHPGDALHVPTDDVDILCVPAQGSWLKLAEVIDFVNEIRPKRALAIHDAQMNERGLEGINHWLARKTDTDYRYLQPGDSLNC